MGTSTFLNRAVRQGWGPPDRPHCRGRYYSELQLSRPWPFHDDEGYNWEFDSTMLSIPFLFCFSSPPQIFSNFFFPRYKVEGGVRYLIGKISTFRAGSTDCASPQLDG